VEKRPRKTASRMRNYLPLIASLANRPERKFFQSVLQHTEILLVTLKGGLFWFLRSNVRGQNASMLLQSWPSRECLGQASLKIPTPG
jgi:hypothetical protein